MRIQFIYLAVVVATTIWVGIDASNLGVRRGRLGGSLVDMSVTSWVICCFFLWIISFPCYLVARSKYRALSAYSASAAAVPAPGQLPHSWQPVYAGQPLYSQPAYSQPAPGPISPDGRWQWDGRQWQPIVAS